MCHPPLAIATIKLGSTSISAYTSWYNSRMARLVANVSNILLVGDISNERVLRLFWKLGNTTHYQNLASQLVLREDVSKADPKNFEELNFDNSKLSERIWKVFALATFDCLTIFWNSAAGRIQWCFKWLSTLFYILKSNQKLWHCPNMQPGLLRTSFKLKPI